MKPNYTTTISTGYGSKHICVYCCDVLDFDEEIQILTTSAFRNSYEPTPRSLFGALYNIGIHVMDLAVRPALDLRDMCHVWLSEDTRAPGTHIRRIGCIELTPMWCDRGTENASTQSMLHSIRAYFQMLDIAATYRIPMDTVALPLLGAGDQDIDSNLIMIPIITECIAFLKRNAAVRRICFIERSLWKAQLIMRALQSSYAASMEDEFAKQPKIPMKMDKAFAFISYSSPDKNIADNLCAKLEREGIRVWYAPRDVRGPYAGAIAEAITQVTHFIVILSRNSLHSEHVLNEIDLAFKGLPDRIKFKPLRIDEAMFTPAFDYYLSRQHWMDAVVPPLEQRLEEFVAKIISDL